MTSYKAYPAYQDSGVEWLGEIPEGWDSSPLKYISTCNDDVLTEVTPPGFEIEYVDIGSVSASEGINKTEKYEFAKSPSRARRKVKDGDIIVSTVRTYLKAIAPIVSPSKNMIVSTGFAVIRPKNNLFPRYAAYALRTSGFINEVVTRSVGVSYPAINSSDLINIEVPFPRFDEQTQIANFLDHETARIDTLIAKQKALIALLKEKRQAVISHAVTKGLNPDAPMKDSGVEWLGEVPAHWACTSLKHFASVIDCKHITAQFFDEGIPLASIGEVKEKYVNLKTAKFTNEAFYNDLISGGRRPQQGDIIYSRNATVGESALVPEEITQFAMGQDVCLIRPEEFLYSEFLLYTLKSGLIYQQLDLAMVGSTFKRINVDDIRNFLVNIPSFEEQLGIVQYLDNLLVKYDALISKAEQAINLMKERRTALISAAVTGKIDVRDWVAPETQAELEEVIA